MAERKDRLAASEPATKREKTGGKRKDGEQTRQVRTYGSQTATDRHVKRQPLSIFYEHGHGVHVFKVLNDRQTRIIHPAQRGLLIGVHVQAQQQAVVESLAQAERGVGGGGGSGG